MSLLNGKKIKELQNENEELKKLIDGLSEKENQLKHFDDLVKKARLEYAEIATKKNQTAQKLEALDKDKAKLINELNKISLEIKQLREMKLSENNQIFTLRKAFNNSTQNSDNENENSLKSKKIISNEIEAAESRKNDIALETFKLRRKFDEINHKISDGRNVLDKLQNDIEQKKVEISSLIQRQSLLSEYQSNNINLAFDKQTSEENHTKISSLNNQEKEITEKLNVRRKQLDDLEKLIEQKKVILSNQSNITSNDDTLELEIKIEAQEARLTSLTNELKAKIDLQNELNSENKKILEELKSGGEKLTKLKESIEIETIRLTDLDYSLNILEDEFYKLSKEISQKMDTKEEIELQTQEKENEKVDLEDLLKELKETTTIIAQLKYDIEKGSGQSAKRFTGVLQYYSTMINDIYKKKTDLEKTLIQKEKEFKEKQNLIDKQQSTLQEMENVLFVRHHRAEIINDLTKAITEQRKQFEKNSFGYSELTEKNNLPVSNDISEKRLLEYENALKEIVNSSDKYASDLISKRSSLEKDIAAGKMRLNELNQNIRYSTNEFSELKNSISKIKIEHEGHRVSINKLGAVRTKLDEQINKYQIVIDKYIKIKGLIRKEQELIKMNRESGSPVIDSNEIKNVEKILESHNPNWIKT